MKTEAELKKLAEFAAEFLKLTKIEGSNLYRFTNAHGADHASYKDFFYSLKSPILAHLAKREMEKRGYAITHYSIPKEDDVYHQYIVGSETRFDTNEYIALWNAIEASGEK